MKRERVINLAPLLIVAIFVLTGGLAWGVGAYLFEDPTTHKSYPNKTVAGFLGVQSGGTVEVQTGAQPRVGQALIAGCTTGTGTSTTTSACFGDLPSGLPTGTPGQVLGVGTVTTTGTAVGTSWQPVNGSIYAGSNVTISKGTSTETNSSAGLAESPKIHVIGLEPAIAAGHSRRALCFGGAAGTSVTTNKGECQSIIDSGSGGVYISNPLQNSGIPGKGAGNLIYDSSGSGDFAAKAMTIAVEGSAVWKQTLNTAGTTATATSTEINPVAAYLPTLSVSAPANQFSTSTPVADGTSGSVGTSTMLNRSDHRHQGDGNDKVSAYAGQTPDYLENVTRSSDSSITLAEFSGDLDIRANFGTTDNTVCEGNDARLSDARTPTAHASTHAQGASDPVSGLLVQQYAYTYASAWAPSGSGSWLNVDPHTITTVGTKITVTAHVTYVADNNTGDHEHLCGLGIVADTGATASTLKTPQSWHPAYYGQAAVFANATIFPSKTLLGSDSVTSKFTLAAGTVTISAAVYRYSDGTVNSCSIQAYGLTIYIDVFN